MAARSAALLLVLALVPAVLADASPPLSLQEQLAKSQFSGFLRLLEAADMLPELEAAASQGQGVTVFAPSDDALVSHASPVLVAFLKQRANKETLRHVLRHHCIAGRLSPFQWEGQPQTLAGLPLRLSMDAQAGNTALSQYNALVSPNGALAVHAVPTLLIPESLSLSFLDDAAQGAGADAHLRTQRMLVEMAGTPGPAPAPVGPTLPESTTNPPPPPKGASSCHVASLLTLAVAVLASVFL